MQKGNHGLDCAGGGEKRPLEAQPLRPWFRQGLQGMLVRVRDASDMKMALWP